MSGINFSVAASFALCLFLVSISPVAQAQDKSGWNARSKTQKVQQCTQRAIAKSVPLYKTAFKGKMDNAEYQAFIQSISQEIGENCQCLIDQIATEYDYPQFESQTQSVTQFAQNLSQAGQPCAPNMDAMVQRIRTAVSPRQ